MQSQPSSSESKGHHTKANIDSAVGSEQGPSSTASGAGLGPLR